MSGFVKFGTTAIPIDNIVKIGIYLHEFPIQVYEYDNADKFAGLTMAFAGKEYIKYKMEKCEVLKIQVYNGGDTVDDYYVHNSEMLYDARVAAKERMNYGHNSRQQYLHRYILVSSKPHIFPSYI